MADSDQILTIRLRVPVGLTEDEAETVAHAALSEAKKFFGPDVIGDFEVDWFNFSELEQ